MKSPRDFGMFHYCDDIVVHVFPLLEADESSNALAADARRIKVRLTDKKKEAASH